MTHRELTAAQCGKKGEKMSNATATTTDRMTCPQCGDMVILFSDYEDNTQAGVGLKCLKCGWKETLADVREKLDARQLALDVWKEMAPKAIASLDMQLIFARNTNKRLNRRCQRLESANIRLERSNIDYQLRLSMLEAAAPEARQ